MIKFTDPKNQIVNGLFELIEKTQERVKIVKDAYDKGIEVDGDWFAANVMYNPNGDKRGANAGSFQESMKGNADEGWAHARGFEHYFELLKEGKLKGEQLENEFDGMTNEGMEDGAVEAVSGEFYSVENYLSGVPECMLDYQPREVSKFINLVVSVACPAMFDIKMMQKRMKVVYQFVNELELTNQVRFRITLLFEVDQKKEENCFAVILKDYQETYSPSTHGFALNNYATIRCMGYGYWCLLNNHGSLGRTPEKGSKAYYKPEKDEIFVMPARQNEQEILKTLKKGYDEA